MIVDDTVQDDRRVGGGLLLEKLLKAMLFAMDAPGAPKWCTRAVCRTFD